MATKNSSSVPRLPERLVERWMRPLADFLYIESTSGLILLGCTVLALVLANSPWAEDFKSIWKVKLVLSLGGYTLLQDSLGHLINDGLMMLFFFVVGLEIKREIVHGELRDPRKTVLPIMAALGGMIVPAAIYYLLQRGEPGERGWGIPMATDIAFVVGFLSLLGSRVPLGLKILLLSLAIADDIGAVLVIAMFYSGNLSMLYLSWGLVGFVGVIILARIGVLRTDVYFILGVLIWLEFYYSGVHPTVAGVILGLLTPARPFLEERAVHQLLHDLQQEVRKHPGPEGEDVREEALGVLGLTAREGVSVLQRLETALHPWVAFVIMPLFALANAGVPVQIGALTHPVAISVAAGLAIGKPLGIFLFGWLAIKLGLARLPSGVNYLVLLGGGCLAGIGFTMSLFIAGLAMKEPFLLDAAKIGTLGGSILSAILGLTLLVLFLPRKAE